MRATLSPLFFALAPLGLILGAATSAPASMSTAPDPTPVTDPFLLLVEDALLPPVPGARDAFVVRDMGEYRLAVGSLSAARALGSAGVRTETLAPLDGSDFYTVSVGSRSPRALPDGAHEVLHRAERSTVIRADPESARALSALGFEIARIFIRPVGTLSGSTDDLLPSREYDAFVQTICDRVDPVRVDATVQRLQDFGTRYAEHDSAYAAAAYIATEFQSYGFLDVVYHFFGPYSPNVVATLPGLVHPEEIVLIGGHYDSISGDLDDCPGADDNASGTAGVLECARILSGYGFDRTLVFVAFSGEELGLLGSEAYSYEAMLRGDDIVAMIAFDMIGYLAEGDDLDIDVFTDTQSCWLQSAALDCALQYVPELPAIEADGIGWANSDHASFWSMGYNAILLFEDEYDYSPYLHSNQDVVGTSYVESDLCSGTIKVAVATLATLAGPDPGSSAFEGSPPPVRVGEPREPQLRLTRCAPNPFESSLRIRFVVPSPGARIDLGVFDVLGRPVNTLIENQILDGEYVLTWDGRDRAGRAAPAGSYFVRMRSGDRAWTDRVLRIR